MVSEGYFWLFGFCFVLFPDHKYPMLASNRYVAENDPEFSILLPSPLEGWGCSLGPPHLIYKVMDGTQGFGHGIQALYQLSLEGHEAICVT